MYSPVDGVVYILSGRIPHSELFSFLHSSTTSVHKLSTYSRRLSETEEDARESILPRFTYEEMCDDFGRMRFGEIK